MAGSHLKYLIPGIILLIYGLYWIVYFSILPSITNMLSGMNPGGNPVLEGLLAALEFMSSPGFVGFMFITGIACICIGLPLLIVGIKKRNASK